MIYEAIDGIGIFLADRTGAEGPKIVTYLQTAPNSFLDVNIWIDGMYLDLISILRDEKCPKTSLSSCWSR